VPVAAGAVTSEPLITGAAVDVTITLKLQVPVLPAASVAVQFTGVEPTLKDVPEAGVQTTLIGVAQPVPVGVV